MILTAGDKVTAEVADADNLENAKKILIEADFHGVTIQPWENEESIVFDFDKNELRVFVSDKDENLTLLYTFPNS